MWYNVFNRIQTEKNYANNRRHYNRHLRKEISLTDFNTALQSVVDKKSEEVILLSNFKTDLLSTYTDRPGGDLNLKNNIRGNLQKFKKITFKSSDIRQRAFWTLTFTNLQALIFDRGALNQGHIYTTAFINTGFPNLKVLSFRNMYLESEIFKSEGSSSNSRDIYKIPNLSALIIESTSLNNSFFGVTSGNKYFCLSGISKKYLRESGKSDSLANYAVTCNGEEMGRMRLRI